MANRSQITILEEGPRNAKVAIVGVLDSSNYSGNVNISSFTNNEPNQAGTFRYFAIQKAEYAINSPLTFVVDWHATTNQLALAIADSNDINFGKGGGLLPSNAAAAGFTGNFDLSTVGYAAASTVGFTILLTLKKIYS
jgi:hypothetical protein